MFFTFSQKGTYFFLKNQQSGELFQKRFANAQVDTTPDLKSTPTRTTFFIAGPTLRIYNFFILVAGPTPRIFLLLS